MSKRQNVPDPTQRAVLTKSRRRCCLCFWLEGIDEVQRGQIAHLDHDPGNNNEDNLCFLCTNEHHDDYDTKRSQSKGLIKSEVKHYRNELYKEMELRFYALEVERRLRVVKQKIRQAAQQALELRALASPSREKAEQWQAAATSLVKSLVGAPAEFDFLHCTEGTGRSDLGSIGGIRSYLYIHARHLKELAGYMDATDLAEQEA